MTSKITSLLFLLNPYTYFYALSGGLEFYMILGVSLVFYIFSKNNNLFESEMNFKSLKKLFMVCLACIFLSSLRPSGAIFSLVVLVYLLINFLKRIMRISSFSSNSFSSILLLSISIVLTINSLFITEKYIFASINVFQETKGNFLGYPRALINEKLLVLKAGNIFSSIKYFIYNSIWKICDLISGFSDLRDTRYGFQDNKALFPFLARVFTGTFYLMPLNVLTILSLIKYFKFIIKRKIYIIFFASFLSISPSLMGMALSRYWIMFYSPFLVLVAKLIFDIFLKKEQEDILIN